MISVRDDVEVNLFFCLEQLSLLRDVFCHCETNKIHSHTAALELGQSVTTIPVKMGYSLYTGLRPGGYA